MNMDYFPATTIWTQLAEILRAGQSGTFFIATSDNNSGRFGIVDGRISHCAYQRLHGDEAVQALMLLEAGRCSFILNQTYPFRERDQVDPTHLLPLLGRLASLVAVPTTVATDVPQRGSLKLRLTNDRYYRSYIPLEE